MGAPRAKKRKQDVGPLDETAQDENKAWSGKMGKWSKMAVQGLTTPAFWVTWSLPFGWFIRTVTTSDRIVSSHSDRIGSSYRISASSTHNEPAHRITASSVASDRLARAFGLCPEIASVAAAPAETGSCLGILNMHLFIQPHRFVQPNA